MILSVSLRHFHRSFYFPKFRAAFALKPVSFFPRPLMYAMVGMTGTGKIHVEQTNLWSIIVEAAALRWNQLSLYL